MAVVVLYPVGEYTPCRDRWQEVGDIFFLHGIFSGVMGKISVHRRTYVRESVSGYAENETVTEA